MDLPSLQLKSLLTPEETATKFSHVLDSSQCPSPFVHHVENYRGNTNVGPCAKCGVASGTMAFTAWNLGQVCPQVSDAQSKDKLEPLYCMALSVSMLAGIGT